MHPAALTACYLGTDLDRRYRLERLIGEGATSWVFAATDLRLEREVAVKLLKPRAEAEHAAQRLGFLNEGRMLAKLAHPHVVAVHDAGETVDSELYLVMELSRAGSLEAELQRAGLLGAEQTLSLLVPILGALACAHDLGVIHRDLKPANIALARERGMISAKLLDFGIAKPTDLAASSGTAIGTPAYMAPEQARADALGPQVDVWGMGVILFRCLSGRLPFEAKSSASLLLKLVQERAARIASVCPRVPPSVAVALDRALEPDPQCRYPDMRAFAKALALACRLDGVRLPAQPEPVGLPEFADWMAQADLEATGPVAARGAACAQERERDRSKTAGERATTVRASSVQLSSAGARSRALRSVLLGSAAVLGAATLWAGISHSAPLTGQNSRPLMPPHYAAQGQNTMLLTPASARAVPVQTLPTVAWPETTPTVGTPAAPKSRFAQSAPVENTQLTAEHAMEAAAAHAAAARPAERRLARMPRAPEQRAAREQDNNAEAAPSSPNEHAVPPTSGLVTNWDW